MQCGGGVRFRVRMCGSSYCTTQGQSCNTQECKPEPQLLGMYVYNLYIVMGLDVLRQ